MQTHFSEALEKLADKLGVDQENVDLYIPKKKDEQHQPNADEVKNTHILVNKNTKDEDLLEKMLFHLVDRSNMDYFKNFGVQEDEEGEQE